MEFLFARLLCKKILEYKQIVLLVVFMGFNMAAILIHEEK